MYHHIRGLYTEKTADGVVVEAGGVGYELLMAERQRQALGALNQEVKVYTYLHLSQDQQSLYAFSDKESRELFLLLISVNRVGPKLALAVLEQFSPADFSQAVVQNDLQALTTVKGLGKRTAERIVLELSDKLKEQPWAPEHLEVEPLSKVELAADNAEFQATVDGLLYLGFTPAEAQRRVGESFSAERSIEENLKAALAQG